MTNELDEVLTIRFQKLIGVIRWSIELGNIYIMTEVTCSPHEGHLNSVYNIIRSLQNNISKNKGRVAIDTVCVLTNEKVFEGRKK